MDQRFSFPNIVTHMDFYIDFLLVAFVSFPCDFATWWTSVFHRQKQRCEEEGGKMPLTRQRAHSPY